MRSQSLVLVFVSLLIAASSSACMYEVEVEPDERCSHEGWFGPRYVCPEGYMCNDSESWTCTKD